MAWRAIIFDLDGTLVHSAPDLHRAAEAMLEEIDRPTVSLEQVTGFVGNGIPKLVERCLEVTGGQPEDQGAEALAIFSRHYCANPTALTRPYPGVTDLLETLLHAGKSLGICTNKPEGPARQVLEGTGLSGYFASVVGGDTLAQKKPHPAPLGRCLADLGVAPSGAVYVGDSETDAATAKAAELPFALFTGGYRKSPITDLPHDFAFDHFGELQQWLGT